MDNAILDLCAFVVREGWEQREDEGDYPRRLAQKALAEADALRAKLDEVKADAARQHADNLMLTKAGRALLFDRFVSAEQRLNEAHADLAAHKRALAAGPAALRAHGRSEGHLRVASMDGCAEMVEAAQAAAMKEKP